MTGITGRLSTALADRYTIERHLGAGGMATVYLAEDLKHKRKVAVKVLRPELAAVLGAERFVQEITTTANLQHPHILPLFDSGEADGFLYYVMPYIEGETLRDKLNRETQLGIEEAIRITTEVADALDHAHRHNVIHRDIKPENILLQDGRPMVADFGIALAVSAAAGGRMTETGLSLGTPHYMSPEQATAEKDLTNRSDIYSLGCVLYEMLTGDPPHTGSSAQQIIMKIVTDTPRPVTELRKSVPPNVTAAVAKALEKLAADRFESAKALAEALTNPAFTLPASAATSRVGAIQSPWNRMSAATTALAGLLLVVALWGWLRTPRVTPAVPLQASLLFSGDSGPVGEGLALSPDGTRLAFVTHPGIDGGRIWIRSLKNGERRPLVGTEQAADPAWSRDGTRIAFRVAREEIRVVRADGGPVTVAARVPRRLGVPSWGPDGSILFAVEGDIWSVPEGGGAPIVIEMDAELADNTPVQVLPAGRGFVTGGTRGIFAGDFTTGEYTVLAEGARHPRYVDGWLIFSQRGGAIVAQRFDPESKILQGPIVPLANDIPAPFGRLQFAVSENTFVYLSRDERAAGAGSLGWVDSLGRVSDAFPRVPGFTQDLSRDGSRIASAGWGLWVADTEDGLPRRIEGAGRAVDPRWSEDASTVLYWSSDGLRMIGTSVGDSAILVMPGRGLQLLPVGWGPEGEILFIENFPNGASELRVRPASGGGEIRTVQVGATHASLSPNGMWLAYESAEGSRQSEVYVRAYQDPEEIRRISADGGFSPAWGPAGDRVFFVTPRGEAMVSLLSFERGISASVPTALPIDVRVDAEPGNVAIGAHPDGRLLLDRDSGAWRSVTVLRDWQSLGGVGVGNE